MPAETTDMVSHLITGGGGIGSGAIATFVVLRLLGKQGNGTGNVSNSDLASKMDKFIEAQHATNVLLAEIKGSLGK